MINFLQQKNLSKIQIVGIDATKEPNSSNKGTSYEVIDNSILRVIPIDVDCPHFSDVIKSVSTVNEIKETYSKLIDNYIKIIRQEKPDLILLNGTYFVPWSLFQAGSIEKIPMVLHYHGILTKETSQYDPSVRDLIHKMETTFDNDSLLYIFPSKLAQKTVEEEVFGHQISRSVVIPNPIPNYFFETKGVNSQKEIAFVGRWSNIKNPKFIKKFIKYNQNKLSDYRINIVSDKEKASKDLLDYANSVKFYSPMENKKLANFYGKMGIVISPSFFETYGNVAQESIASGTPALVGPNMGVSEIFRQVGLSDFIVDFSSTKNVYYKIKKFSGRPIDKKVKDMLKYNLTPNIISEKLIKALKSA
ncbi:MAG TPA: glycosyltransferase family 4 protein [Candidatus Woesebacteria bacterium]|nr:glycosyltransferase family 4 protein [Candidatus Woesebacteria bacterium]